MVEGPLRAFFDDWTGGDIGLELGWLPQGFKAGAFRGERGVGENDPERRPFCGGGERARVLSGD